MRRVQQEHENSCGAACVAMLSGCTYEEAVGLVGSGTTSERQLRKGLRQKGVELGENALDGKAVFSGMKADGLLRARIMNPQDLDERWSHWLVWDAKIGAILDPTRQAVKARFTRITGYFPIK